MKCKIEPKKEKKTEKPTRTNLSPRWAEWVWKGDGHTLNATDKGDEIRNEQNFSVYLLWIDRKAEKKKTSVPQFTILEGAGLSSKTSKS